MYIINNTFYILVNSIGLMQKMLVQKTRFSINKVIFTKFQTSGVIIDLSTLYFTQIIFTRGRKIL